MRWLDRYIDRLIDAAENRRRVEWLKNPGKAQTVPFLPTPVVDGAAVVRQQNDMQRLTKAVEQIGADVAKALDSTAKKAATAKGRTRPARPGPDDDGPAPVGAR